ncbi:MAG: hypothetical protein NTW19_13510 [Planctomycetota bacterium]|nr:hypothetical protein [Planctomycetota bacterium]
MRTLEGSRGMTLGVAGMVCVYTLLAVLVGSMNLFAERMNEMSGFPYFPQGFTPGLVTIAWIASLALVMTIPFCRQTANSFYVLWGVHAALTVAWAFAALFPVMRIIFPPYATLS